MHDHLGYERDSIHGVTSYFGYVIPELQRQGLSVHLCVLSKEHSSRAWLEKLGVSCTFLGSSRFSPGAISPLARFFRKVRPQAVHAAGFKSILMSRIVAAQMHIGSVIHLHDNNRVPVWMRPVQRALGPRTGAAVACSEAVTMVASDFGVPPDRTHVLHNALPLARFAAVSDSERSRLRQELEIAADARIVSVVGQLREGKGQRVMLDALPMLLERIPQVLVLFAGVGPDEEFLKARAEALGVSPQVRWLGFRRDVATIISSSEAVAVPSAAHEGFGYPLIEAYAAGVPVVGSAIGGIPEVIVDNKTGLLVPPGNPEALATAIFTILDDRQLQSEMARHASERAALFDVEHHARRLGEIYEKAFEFAQ